MSSVLGVANSLVGLVIFSLLFAAGLFLFVGAKPSKNMKKIIVGLSIVLFLFSIWFFAVSLYVIGKICIFCAFIWAATMPLFLSTMREYDKILFSDKSWLKPVRNYIDKNLVYSTVLIYVVMIGLFLLRFRDYYF